MNLFNKQWKLNSELANRSKIKFSIMFLKLIVKLYALMFFPNSYDSIGPLPSKILKSL